MLFTQGEDHLPEAIFPKMEIDPDSVLNKFYLCDQDPAFHWPRARRISFEDIEDQKWDLGINAIVPGDKETIRKVKVSTVLWTDMEKIKIFYGDSNGIEPIWALFEDAENPLTIKTIDLHGAMDILRNHADFDIKTAHIHDLPVYDSKFVGEGKFSPMTESNNLDVIDNKLVKITLKLEKPFKGNFSLDEKMKFTVAAKKFQEAFNLMLMLLPLVDQE